MMNKVKKFAGVDITQKVAVDTNELRGLLSQESSSDTGYYGTLKKSVLT